jgi:hypothetical protein
MALCEAFYPLLHALEVGLRNATDRAMTIKQGRLWLQQGVLQLAPWQQQAVRESLAKLGKLGRKPENGRLVAELPFGFWTSLYNRRFERAWHGILKHAFPNLRGPMRTRRTIATRLEDIRRFRNRIFHHERIIHHDFMRFRSEILDTIAWMSPELSCLTARYERVQKVYEAGPSAFVDSIAAILTSDA